MSQESVWAKGSVSRDSSAYLTEKCALRNRDVSGGFGVYACSVIATGDLIGGWSGPAACFGLPKRARSTKPRQPNPAPEPSMRIRPLPICLFLAVLSGTAGFSAFVAHAADIWRVKTSGSFVALRYGAFDEQEKPVFLLSCLNGVGIAVLSVHMDFPERETGEAITIDFSAGGKTTPVAGETAAEDGTGVIYGEAGDIAVTPILNILKEKGPVTIKVGANAVELSTQGRAETVAEFSKDCSLD